MRNSVQASEYSLRRKGQTRTIGTKQNNSHHTRLDVNSWCVINIHATKTAITRHAFRRRRHKAQFNTQHNHPTSSQTGVSRSLAQSSNLLQSRNVVANGRKTDRATLFPSQVVAITKTTSPQVESTHSRLWNLYRKSSKIFCLPSASARRRGQTRRLWYKCKEDSVAV